MRNSKEQASSKIQARNGDATISPLQDIRNRDSTPKTSIIYLDIIDPLAQNNTNVTRRYSVKIASGTGSTPATPITQIRRLEDQAAAAKEQTNCCCIIL